MAEIVVMPQLGNTVESCLVTAWRVGVGDAVTPATVVAEIETDKSTMEVPAGASGTVLALLVAQGAEVPVKAPLLIVGAPGESVEGLVPAAAAPRDASVGGEPVLDQRNRPAEAPAAPPATGPVRISPRARAKADAAGLDLATLTGTGPHGRIVEADIAAAIAAAKAAPPVPPVPAEPPAPAAPTYPGGTGLGGRLTRADLANAPVVPPSAPAAPAEFPGTYTEAPLVGIRKLVATRMLASMAEHAQLTFDASAPATALLALRARFKGSDPALGLSGITVGDMVAYAAVRTLASHPALNSTIANQVLRHYDAVHLGLAVDTPRGLLVPTIRFASSLELAELSRQAKALADAARSGRINPDQLAGATFTVTNLGAYGIESFTPILNGDQVAILGVNAIRPMGAESRISFSLTVDHGVIDGADAARYLKALTQYIADIDLMLLAGEGNRG